MAWSSSALMESQDDSIPEYLLIRQITLKSERTASAPLITTAYSYITIRVLLASLRDKGCCPCPRCLMPLNKVHNLGTATDMKQRQTLARVDNEDRRNKVQTARSIIYERGYAVKNDASEAILKDESLVATKVSHRESSCSAIKTDASILERVFREAWPLRIQSFCHACCRFDA